MVSWDALNPILSLSEWIGDCARSSKLTKREPNNNLPPLLQRTAISNRNYDEIWARTDIDNEDEDNEVLVLVHPRSFSTFASRWNQKYSAQVQDQEHERVMEDKRSSIIIPNKEEGELYVVSSDPVLQEPGKRKRDEEVTAVGSDEEMYSPQPSAQQKRDDGGVPGTIDIMVLFHHISHSKPS